MHSSTVVPDTAVEPVRAAPVVRSAPPPPPPPGRNQEHCPTVAKLVKPISGEVTVDEWQTGVLVQRDEHEKQITQAELKAIVETIGYPKGNGAKCLLENILRHKYMEKHVFTNEITSGIKDISAEESDGKEILSSANNAQKWSQFQFGSQ